MDAAAQQMAPAQPAPATEYQFDVFISYATVPDAKLVRAIERFLEGFYRVRLLEGAPLRPLQVCVDGTDFALRRMPRGRVTGVVENVVEQALDTYLAQSRLLLVCCSSGAVASRYVAHEIEWFLAQNREADIMLAVTEGANPMAHPEQVFPAPVIRQRLHERPWSDLRDWHWWKRRRWKRVRSFDAARVRLAADVYGDGVKFENVYPPWWQEERKRRVRLILGVVVAGALIIAASTVAASRMRAAWNLQLDTQSQGLAATANALVPADPELAALLAREAVTHHTTEAETALREATAASRIRRRIEPAGASAVRDVAWSADGKRLLTVETIADGNDRVEVWDAASGGLDGPPLAHRGVVTAATFSPDGTAILTIGRDEGALLWRRDTTEWRRAGDAFAPGVVLTGAFDPSGRRLALGESNAEMGVWAIDGSRTEPERRIEGSAAAEHVAFDRKGEWIAWTTNGSVFVWSAATDTRGLNEGSARNGLVNSLTFAPDGHLLVATGREVESWRPTETHADQYLLHSASVVRSVDVRPQGDLVAVALDDGTVPVLSLAGGGEVISLRGHRQRVNRAVFSPDGESVVTAGEDGSARVWGVEPNSVQVIEHQPILRRPGSKPGAARAINASGAAFNADGSRLATADTAARGTRIWNPRSGLVRDLGPEIGTTNAAAFSPLPSQPCAVVVGGGSRTAQVWDFCTGAAGPRLGPLTAAVTLIAVDPGGTHALLASRRDLRVVDIASNEPVAPAVELDGRLLTAGFSSADSSSESATAVVVSEGGAQIVPLHTEAAPSQVATDAAPLSAAALSGDGRVLAIAGKEVVRRIDTTTGACLDEQPTAQPITVLAISRDGTHLAAATEDHVYLIEGPPVPPLEHAGVTAAAFDPSGDLLVTAGRGGTLEMWSVPSGDHVAHEQFDPRGGDDTERVEQLLFSPDGDFLVARSSGPAVRIYGRERFRPLPEVQKLLKHRVTRDLTPDERRIYLQEVGHWWWP